MRLVFSERAWNDYLWFQEREKKLAKRINTLLKETMRTPFTGMGKPERLGANLSGYWSRRINHEHRMVYAVKDDQLILASFRYHYES